MSWLRLDDDFASHPKIAALTDRELRVWLRVLCYCAKHQDPTVDRVAFREIKGLTSRSVSRFVELELLDESGTDYEVHEWVQYQPKDATGADRQAKWRARRNAERNALRNGERNASNRDADRDETVTSRAGTRPRPSRTVEENPRAVTEANHADDQPPPDEPIWPADENRNSPGDTLDELTPELRRIM